MIQAHMNRERAVPLWAALGTPLVGVPLMVALLALAAPSEPVVETETSFTIEQVDVPAIELGTDIDAE